MLTWHQYTLLIVHFTHIWWVIFHISWLLILVFPFCGFCHFSWSFCVTGHSQCSCVCVCVYLWLFPLELGSTAAAAAAAAKPLSTIFVLPCICVSPIKSCMFLYHFSIIICNSHLRLATVTTNDLLLLYMQLFAYTPHKYSKLVLRMTPPRCLSACVYVHILSIHSYVCVCVHSSVWNTNPILWSHFYRFLTIFITVHFLS